MSNLYGPNGAPVVDLALDRAEIGGTPVDFQSRSDVGVTFSPEGFGIEGLQIGAPGMPSKVVYVMTKPENVLNILAAYTNLNSAFIREFLAMRARLEALEGQPAASEPTERIETGDTDGEAQVG